MGEKETMAPAAREGGMTVSDDLMNEGRVFPETNRQSESPPGRPAPSPAEGTIVKSKSNITNNREEAAGAGDEPAEWTSFNSSKSN